MNKYARSRVFYSAGMFKLRKLYDYKTRNSGFTYPMAILEGRNGHRIFCPVKPARQEGIYINPDKGVVLRETIPKYLLLRLYIEGSFVIEEEEEVPIVYGSEPGPVRGAGGGSGGPDEGKQDALFQLVYTVESVPSWIKAR